MESVEVLAPVVGAVRHHHERWDGKGYPDGLSGEGLPLAARLVAVADAFDVMTRDRPYRRGASPEDALEGVWGDFGKRFDPSAVETLLRVVGGSPHDTWGRRRDRVGPA
ncbi:MAG: HD domain-containing protein [Actinomycetota bacterium]|nr:HD domain-containing protein [Actinomycetota bacterium]